MAETSLKESIPRQEKSFYLYAGVGFSAFAIIPYAANISLGGKIGRHDSILGLDTSINFTSTYVSQYIFGKLLMPLYFNPDKVTESFYFGPFVTAGFNQQFKTMSQELPKGNSFLAITGVSFGRNMISGERLSFWQLSGNIRRYSPDIRLENSTWPTLMFQYAIGF